MKAPTNRQRQWLWFVGLWLGGLSTTLLLAGVMRFIMAL